MRIYTVMKLMRGSICQSGIEILHFIFKVHGVESVIYTLQYKWVFLHFDLSHKLAKVFKHLVYRPYFMDKWIYLTM